jgi:NTP pyrophosphatase (non-canonical NTP hydrolase)
MDKQKQKSNELIRLYSLIILSEVGNKLTMHEVKEIAEQCALITVDDTFDDMIINVSGWAREKGLLDKENATKQLLKVMEEVGETASAVLKGDHAKVIDGIGDSFVTLIVLSKQLGLEPLYCLEVAWNEIKDRKGKMVDGTFVKESNVTNTLAITQESLSMADKITHDGFVYVKYNDLLICK